MGQKQDYTAIAVVERTEVETRYDHYWMERVKDWRYNVRFLERVRLGTPYTEVVHRVREVVRAADLRERCVLVADATGVGAPVMELLQRGHLGCPIVPVTITGGDGAAYERGGWRVPKRDLVVGLEVMLEQGQLQIAEGLAEGATLLRELTNMKVKVTWAGHESFAAWREGTHDDLVLAVALACWEARRRRTWSDGGERVLGLMVRGV